MKNFFQVRILLFVLFASAVLSANGQNWTGNLNSDWNNPGNWTGWPLAGDDIVIDPVNYTGAAASPVIGSSSVFSPAGVLIQNGAQLTVNANLTASDRVEILGTGTTVTINAGTFHANGGGSSGRFIVGDGAAVNMTGGTLTANQRVIVELGGLFTLDNGLVQSTELAIGEGNIGGSSSFTMTGGSINVDGMGFENEAATFAPTFNMSGGTLTVNGDIAWLGVAPGAGTGRFIMSGGTATVSGNLLNDPASTIDLYFSLLGSAALQLNGTLIDMTRSTDSIRQAGNALLTLNGSASWNNAGVVYATGGTTVFNGSTNLDGTGIYTLYHATINATKTVSHLSASTLRINGNFVSNGTFNSNGHTVLFGGSMLQSISGSSVTAFHHLGLDNAAGLTLNQAAGITGHLQLSNGLLHTSAANLLTLADNASADQGSDASFVNGPLRKTGNDAFVFPIGKNSRWRRLAIGAPALTGTTYTAEYFDTPYSSAGPVSSPLTAVSGIEYWNLENSDPSESVALTLYWEDAAASAITSCAALSMSHWDGSAWNNIVSTASGTCTGTGNGYIQSGASLTQTGVFTFGFYSGVTVVDTAICHGAFIAIGSNTYNVSGTYVDVLTSSTMTDSVVITHLTVSDPATVTGSGITLTAGPADTYQWVDCNNAYAPISGETGQTYTAASNGSYAVVTTGNGCTDTSACYAVSSVGLVPTDSNSSQVLVYPNPSTGLFTIAHNGHGLLHYRVMDLSGRTVLSGSTSDTKVTVNCSAQEAGIYLLETIGEGAGTVTRLVKQ